MDRAELVGGVLDVADGQVLVDLHRAGLALRQEGAQAIVVVAALAHRLLEDRGVGGDALQPVLRDEPLQSAALQELTVDEVEPDGLAGLPQLQQRIGHGLPRAACALAAS